MDCLYFCRKIKQHTPPSISRDSGIYNQYWDIHTPSNATPATNRRDNPIYVIPGSQPARAEAPYTPHQYQKLNKDNDYLEIIASSNETLPNVSERVHYSPVIKSKKNSEQSEYIDGVVNEGFDITNDNDEETKMYENNDIYMNGDEVVQMRGSDSVTGGERDYIVILPDIVKSTPQTGQSDV